MSFEFQMKKNQIVFYFFSYKYVLNKAWDTFTLKKIIPCLFKIQN